MRNHPGKWIVIKLSPKNKEPFYKVLASFSGGYLDGDSWKMNSGITKVVETDTHFEFYGMSGSCYDCKKTAYGMHSLSESILNHAIAHSYKADIVIEQMHPDTDWNTLKY